MAGLLHRRGIAVTLLMTALLAAGAADASAIYKDAAATSGLRARLTSAPALDSGVVVDASGSPRLNPELQLNQLVGHLRFSASRESGMSILGDVDRHSALDVPMKASTSTGQCEHLTMVQGICPVRGVGVAVPVSAAAHDGWRVGSTLTLGQLSAQPNGFIDTNVLGTTVFRPGSAFSPVIPSVRARVVGVYAVPRPSEPYWLGSPPVTTASAIQVMPVTIITTPHLFTRMPHFLEAQAFVAQTLRGGAVTTSDVPALRHSITSIVKANHSGHLAVSTQLPQLLKVNAEENRALSNVSLIAVAQLLALVGVVLVVVLLVGAASRETEVVAASLQGRHPLRVATGIVTEPVVLILAGCLGGVLIAPFAVHIAAGHWLRAGTPVPFLPLQGAEQAVAVALTGVVAAAVVAVRAAYRATRLASDGHSRSSVPWWELAALLVAFAGVVELMTAGGVRSHSTPWALLAPAMCGLAIGLLIARIVPPLLQPLVHRTRHQRRIWLYLLVRELRRDAAAWRLTAVVAMAVSLLSFAVAVDRGAAADRHDRAGLIVGADRVVSVTAPSATFLTHAIDRADPAGRWAMAAVEIQPFGSAAERVLAVQSARLPAVAAWSRSVAGMTPRALGRALQPTPTTPYRFKKRQLTLPVTVSATSRRPTPLTLTIALPSGLRRRVTGPVLQPGTRSVTWQTPACVSEGGCRILGLAVDHPTRKQPLRVSIGGLGSGPWRADNLLVAHEVGGVWHLFDPAFRALSGTEALVRPEYPRLIPVVATSHSPEVVGLDSRIPPVRVAGAGAVLPRLLNAGSLVDLSYLALANTGADPGTTQLQSQVWLGPKAPTDAIGRLQSAGLTVGSIDRSSATYTALNGLDPALALDGYLAVAALAVLLALSLLCGYGAVAARRRRAEFIALATAGASRLSLGCGWFAAAVVRLAFAVGAGFAAGLAVAHLAAPGVPLAAPGTVPTPHLAVPALPAVIAALTTLVPLLIAEAWSVRWSTRTAALRQARETTA
jgi:hypothetical protein